MLRTKNINVNVQRPPTNIPLGRQGENLATCIIFDCTGLVQLYGDGTAELLHELKDGTVYPVAIQQEGASVSWAVSASDTAIVGSGRAELRWYVGDTLAKSAKFRTSVSSALADSTTETPPAPQKSWVDKVLAAAQEIKDGAISEEQLADAIAKALAEAKASGEFDGAPGEAGAPGADGADGVGIQSVEQTITSIEDGGTNIVTVTKTDGTTSTFQVKNGSKGSDGVPGKDGANGADGQNGADGKSAYQYAQDGGYTGTEEEFAAKMAQEIPTVDATLTQAGQAADAAAVGEQLGNLSEENAELKGDLSDKLEKANGKVYIGDIVDNKWQQNNGNEYGSSSGYYLSANVQPNTKYYVSGVIINSSFPLIVMFDENNNVIGAKETSGNITPINDYEFIPPSNCVKVSVNGRKLNSGSNSAYPSLYYIQNKDLDGNDLEYLINSKQNQAAEWKKAEYQYEKNKFVKTGSGNANYKAVVISDSVSAGYNYAKLIYDKNKKYRFFGECKTDAIPILLCCDENDNIIKIYGSNVDEVFKGEEYNDIPENTYCIYVNGYILNARVEIKEQRNTTSFESKKIGVCFGDSITQGNNVYIGSNITPINDYPSVVGKTLDCTVYNGGLGGSTYSSGRSIDFKNVCDCVVSGDFSTVIDGISQYGLNASAVLQYNAISELDFNDVDFISIALGTNDWNFGASAEGIKNAMRYCISTLLTAYPHLKIYVFTPIYRFNLQDSGQDSDNYVNTGSGLKLHDVCDAIIETAKEFNVPCKDMYYGCNINQYNKELYMGDDTHPNANGYALMGEKIAKFINSN